MSRHGHMAAVAGTALVIALAAAALAIVIGPSGRHGHGSATSTEASAAAHRSQPARLKWLTPPTVPTAGTPLQEEGDQLFARGLSATPGLEALMALAVPSPAVSGGWPDLAAANSPEAWAIEFVPALLDIDFARQSRAALGRWAQAEEAPELLPGVPERAADKVLYVSLLAPAIAGEKDTAVPSATGWTALARAHASQSVSGLLVQVDPGWAQLVATGWQPPDPRMDVLDVSGLLSTRRGARVLARRFSCSVAVSSARWHAGYGTVAVGDWHER